MDLYTLRHLATDLLVHQEIRLQSIALCLFEVFLLVCWQIIDRRVVGACKIDSVATPHCRNVMATFVISAFAFVGHDAMKPIPQCHLIMSHAWYMARHLASVRRQIQKFAVLDLVIHLLPLSVNIIPEASHLDHQNLRAAADASIPSALFVPATAHYRIASDSHMFVRKILPDVMIQISLMQGGARHHNLHAGQGFPTRSD